MKAAALKLAAFLALFFLLQQGLFFLFLQGIDRYFGLDRPADVLCIGHSHTVLGLSKPLMSRILETDVAVYAREGADVDDRDVMVRQYLNKFGEASPVIVYDVNAHLFNKTGLSENSYLLFYPFIGDSNVSAYIRSQEKSTSLLIMRTAIAISRFSDITLRYAIRGLAGRWDNLKNATADTTVLHRAMEEGGYPAIDPDSGKVARFRATLDLCLHRSIPVVLVYIPTTDFPFRKDRVKYEEMIRFFRSLEGSYPNVRFLDYNPAFSRRYPLFYDDIHLNGRGQALFTETLCHDLAPVVKAHRAGLHN